MQIEEIKPTILPELQVKRVAAYARVSTDTEMALHSVSAQISYYNELISTHPGWEFAGVYADEGISGTKESRPEFQRMLADCRAGKIDLVITKSITRFARNTVTLLNAIRELKLLGIDVYFEKENMHSLSGTGELMLTLLAMYAEEEARSVSENQRWRIQKMFAEGRPNTGRMLGYRLRDGRLEIIPEEAELVREIFQMYLEGMGANKIARLLNARNTPSFCGGEWNQSVVQKILRNEKYSGDMLLQKTYIADFRSKKGVVNKGERRRYLVENSHEPIIDKATFQKVQEEIRRRREQRKPALSPAPDSYPFTGLIVCGICGRKMQRNCVSNRQTVPREPLIFCISRSACPTISHRYDEIERMVLDTLRVWLAGYSSDGSPLPCQDEAAPLRASLRLLEKRLSELDTRMSRAFELVETGVYTPALYLERKNALDAERASLLRQQNEMQTELEQLENAAARRRAFAPWLRHVLDAYEQAANAREQNRLLKTVIEKIVYTKTERVTANHPGNLHLQIYPRLPSLPAATW